MKQFDVKIVGLVNGKQKINYKIDTNFFQLYEHNLLENGDIDVEVIINENAKKSLLHFNFKIKGRIELICDRSLEKYFYPIEINKVVFFEYGDNDEEIDIDHYMINSKKEYVNIAQHIHDFISLEVPIKKLHPKFGEVS